MSKHSTKRIRWEAPSSVGEIPREYAVDLLGFLVDTRSELLDLAVKTGLEVLQQTLGRERVQLCGPKRKMDPNRWATRYGYDDGQVVLGGRRVGVRKPRVRSVKGTEIPLPTYQHFSRTDPLEAQSLEQMILGVSTRHYARSLEPIEEEELSGGRVRAR